MEAADTEGKGAKASGSKADEYPTPWWSVVPLTAYLVLLPLVFLDGIIDVLRGLANAGTDGPFTIGVGLFDWHFAWTVPAPGLLIALAFLAGGLGASVHASQSLATYVGNRVFRSSWTPWFILRPIVGASLAVVFHMAVTSGLLAAVAGGTLPSAGATTGLGALVGLFSRQATDRLGDMADKVFRNRADPERKDGFKGKTVTVPVDAKEKVPEVQGLEALTKR